MTIDPKNIDSKEPSTKGDLEQLREDLQVDLSQLEHRLKTEMTGLEDRIADRLDAWGQALFDKMDSLIENRTVELGAAKQEEVSLLQDKVRSLGERVTAVEKQRELPDRR